MNTGLRTLVLIFDSDRILLGRKKRGFGRGRWNGFGGKLQAGETLLAAAGRELAEEAGIEALLLEQRAVLGFTFANGLDPLEIHVFVAAAWQGEPIETEEMAPAWFSLADIPYGEMWADDPLWLPRILRGEHVRGEFLFKDTDTLLNSRVKSVAAATSPWHGKQ